MGPSCVAPEVVIPSREFLRAGSDVEDATNGSRKGTNGVSADGVTADLMLF